LSLRSYLRDLEKRGELLRIVKPADRRLQVAGVLKALEERPLLFERVSGAEFPVVGNLFGDRRRVAAYFGIEPGAVMARSAAAIDAPGEMPRETAEAPCQECELPPEALGRLPLLLHCEGDGGPYITSGVCLARHPRFGLNMDFHRAQQIGPRKLALRVVGGRHFDQFLREQKEMPVAICVGNGLNVLLAAAISVEKGRNELEIANALQPLTVTRARCSDLLIPAEAEFVIEGVIRLQERVAEGPFVDLTETADHVRQEPVLTVECITHRRDAIWQALLSGGLEHKMLMGMPREPTIYRAVREAGVECLDVSITPGGCSWLHAVIQIRKREEADGPRALRAAFAGHRSLKHAFVVDGDIDPLDPRQVEWAMATRYQFDRDTYPAGREPGSSLDPSAESGSKRTAKVGFDFTAPLAAAERVAYERVEYPRVDLADFLDRKELSR
jgi:UbiD family decarboxylase